jgi:hypothetical protein
VEIVKEVVDFIRSQRKLRVGLDKALGRSLEKRQFGLMGELASVADKLETAIGANADLGEVLNGLSDEALEALSFGTGAGRKSAKKTGRRRAGKTSRKRAVKKSVRKRTARKVAAKRAAKQVKKRTPRASKKTSKGSKGATQPTKGQRALIEDLAKKGTTDTSEFQTALAEKFPGEPRLNGNSIQAIARRAVA